MADQPARGETLVPACRSALSSPSLQPALWAVMLLLCTARWILGAIVILATGFAATAWLGYTGFQADGWSGLILPSVVAILTLAAALAVARF